MRIVVAGAAGHLGIEMTTTLAEAGHSVVACDTNPARLEPLRSRLAGLHAVDLRQPESLGPLLAGAEAVVTTVGIGRPKAITDFQAVDFQGNLNLLRAAQQQGARRFVYTSVIGVDTDPGVPVLKAKLAFEGELTRSGLSYLILRPSSYFTDVWRTFMTSAQKGRITLVGTREAYRFSPIHPGDVARFVAQNLDGENRTANLGGPEQFTYPEIADLCFKLLGKPTRLQIIPLPAFDSLLAVLKLVNPALWSVMRFLRWASTRNLVAPPAGLRTVRTYLQEQLKQQAPRAPQ